MRELGWFGIFLQSALGKSGFVPSLMKEVKPDFTIHSVKTGEHAQQALPCVPEIEHFKPFRD